AKCLLRVVPQLRCFDFRSLAEFFVCGCTLQNRSLFAGISILPPGSILTIDSSTRVDLSSYFDKSQWEDQAPLSSAECYDSLSNELASVIPAYAKSNQRVGLSLTGGIDSRTIIAAVQPKPNTLPCFTFGGMYRECEDVRISTAVARKCKQTHE